MNSPGWKLIGRGKCGWHAESDNVSSSGGNVDPYMFRGQPRAGYAAEAVDGAWVYDAADADYVTFARFVSCGPIPRPSMDPLGSDALDITKPMSMDYVGVELYIRLLRESVPGVRIGRVFDGKVEWENTHG